MIDHIIEILEKARGRQDIPSEIISYLISYMFFSAIDVSEQVSYLGAKEIVNIFGVKGPRDGDGGLLLVAPVVTKSFIGDDAWTPVPQVLDGAIVGAGSARGFADALAKVLAVARVHRDSLSRPVGVALLFSEEIELSGSRLLLDEHHFGRWEKVLVGHPTGMKPVLGHPGFAAVKLVITPTKDEWRVPPAQGIFSITVEGALAHSSAPHLGVDACAGARALIAALGAEAPASIHDLTVGDGIGNIAGAASFCLLYGHETLPDIDLGEGLSWEATSIDDASAIGRPVTRPLEHLTMLLERIQGSLPEGVTVTIPTVTSDSGALSTVLTIRSDDDAHAMGLLEACHDTAKAFTDVTKGWRVEVDPLWHVPAFEGSEDSELFRAVDELLGGDGTWLTHPAATDAGVLGEHGMDVVVLGPGVIYDNWFTPRERIPLSEIEAAIATYEGLIERFCKR